MLVGPGGSKWESWWVLMDPSVRWILVDSHDGSWWIHMMDPGGSMWWLLVDPLVNSWVIPFVDLVGFQWRILVDPQGGFWLIQVVALR